jgi:Ca2+-binding RTX toxin-like protein
MELRRTWQLALTVVAAGLALAHPGGAFAGTAGVSGSTLTYVAANGEANAVVLQVWDEGSPSQFWVLTDSGAPVTAAAGCTQLTDHSVDCGNPAAAHVDLGDLDDAFHLSKGLVVVVTGGAGNDTLHGGNLADVLDGGTGDDSLDPGAGTDTVAGGLGDDSIDASWCEGPPPCAAADHGDSFSGGDGVDSVSYNHRPLAVTVTLDGIADDGQASEQDTVGADIENVTGGDGDDTIVGTDGPNVLDGGSDYNGGHDSIDGRGGDDFLIGGMSFGDTLVGGAGNDHLLAAMSGGGTLDGGAGDDLLEPQFLGVPPPVTITGGDGIDTVTYAGSFHGVTISFDDVANDGAGNDNVRADVENAIGSGGADTFFGSSADNVFDGNPGSDVFNGGGGIDTVSYSTRSGSVHASIDGIANDGERPAIPDENDNIEPDIENVVGGSGPDVLVGSSAANTLSGGPGDDALDGGPGADTLVGGTGADTADYSSRSVPLVISLDATRNDGAAGENDLVAADVESVFGGSANDVLSGGAGDNLLRGGLGADQIHGGGGIDTVDYSERTVPVHVSLDGVADDGGNGERDNIATDVETVVAGSGDDVLVGSDQANTLIGGDGDDLLDGRLGADVLIGGDGEDDTVDYSKRTRSVTVALDGSQTSGERGEGDRIAADVEDALGGSGADVFVGNAADNIFDGGPGRDSFSGGAGADFVDYSSRRLGVSVSLDARANDGVTGEHDNVGDGIEAVVGGSGADRMTGNGKTNLFVGGPGADFLQGAGGRDVLLGGAGRDRISGGPGVDVISGEAGADAIQSRDRTLDAVDCGAGADTATADVIDVAAHCEKVRVVCLVPDVRGATLGDAKKAIRVFHCTVGEVRSAYSAKIPRGRVVAQRPQPGTQLKDRGRVALVVSRGRKR